MPGRAQRALTGGLPTPDFAVTGHDAEARASLHPDVVGTQARWSAGTREAGYDL